MELRFDIDLVYLWCDGNEPEFKRKRLEALASYHGVELDKDSSSDYRFIEMDELKYSLRSAEKFAPWVRNIYIITNAQVPQWLNVNHPKINIIDHKDIIPAKYLPMFNSSAIEIFLPNIEGLSEHFLYANDDMFFWGNVEKDFFFTPDGAPIVRTSKRMGKKNKAGKSLFGTIVRNARKMVLDKFGKDVPYWSHHGIDSYRKSDYLECIKSFKEQYELTAQHTFREFTDVQRMIVSYYAVAEKGAVIKEYPRRWFEGVFPTIHETCYSSCTIKKMKRFRGKDFKLFCINDGAKTTDKDRLYMKTMLEEKFPEKSAYEL